MIRFACCALLLAGCQDILNIEPGVLGHGSGGLGGVGGGPGGDGGLGGGAVGGGSTAAGGSSAGGAGGAPTNGCDTWSNNTATNWVGNVVSPRELVLAGPHLYWTQSDGVGRRALTDGPIAEAPSAWATGTSAQSFVDLIALAASRNTLYAVDDAGALFSVKVGETSEYLGSMVVNGSVPRLVTDDDTLFFSDGSTLITRWDMGDEDSIAANAAVSDLSIGGGRVFAATTSGIASGASALTDPFELRCPAANANRVAASNVAVFWSNAVGVRACPHGGGTQDALAQIANVADIAFDWQSEALIVLTVNGGVRCVSPSFPGIVVNLDEDAGSGNGAQLVVRGDDIFTLLIDNSDAEGHVRRIHRAP